ncbi:DUF2452 domain-containing protein [Pontibacter sp. G13]|uniref:DUF2452 domain-containing protein n=1 Tax=Pontibacter sp. G13 TaxID=3074898 RepID=UPI00288AE370|nr:DUF2452 domain-containing protein [Pontibacter sp. G13]WNJ18862.1 DUF2452 domain-containing protein [Pontibacter sp. G13]
MEKPKNPIDPDKVAENPSTLPYAHSVGGAPIEPTKEGAVKSQALSAMESQTDMQLAQIREQIELLARQAQEIQDRKDISEKIYRASIGFTPLINHVYHLYEKMDSSWVLSMVAPEEWGASSPYAAFVASVRLLADHTWHIERKGAI